MHRVSVPTDRVALIGVGASSLTLDLIDQGYSSIDAVDISDEALNQLRMRLSERNAGAPDPACRLVEGTVRSGDGVGPAEFHKGVRFVLADAREVAFEGKIDLWHDRATLHFLNDPQDQALYVERATEAVRRGGHLIVATFGANGPEQCSGLPVTRHTGDSLKTLFAGTFDLQDCFEVQHTTPWGSTQAFTYALFQRNNR